MSAGRPRRGSGRRLREPIAIAGIGCRVPGARGPRELWRLLCDGVDAVREIPADRWSIGSYFGARADSSTTYTKWGGFVDGFELFDAAFFGISAQEAAVMDPQQRALLETSWESLEDAGLALDRSRRSDAGVFVGFSTWEYQHVQVEPSERVPVSPFASTGQAGSILANRISHFLNLIGPSVAVDTACSSSLVAIHLAAESIRRGECSWALAGGVNYILVPRTFIAFSRMGAMAADGRCKAFSAAADGFVRGEGAVVLTLLPLSLARQVGLPVHALLRETGTNQDGRTPGITSPSLEAQRELVRSVCARARVDPGELAFVEAHGTGTPIGDPIEARALGAACGARRRAGGALPIGSLKTNIGHLEAAAGAASVAKAALCLRHRWLPQNLHFDEPNPAIDFETLRLRVPTVGEPLEPAARGALLAGVNSFGFGGSNAFALLEAAPPEPEAPPCRDEGGVPLVVPLSAHAEPALRELAGRWAERLAADPKLHVADLALCGSRHRVALPERAGLVGADRDQLARALRAVAAGVPDEAAVLGRALPDPRPVFVFSGQGQQWSGMGRKLYEQDPVFRVELEACHEAQRRAGGFSLLDELLADEARSRLDETEIAQPCITALQVALLATWRARGVEPAAVVGHSVGEVAAAHAAGRLDREQAMAVILARARAMGRAGAGAMLAVGLSAEAARERLARYAGRLCLGAVNSPESVTVSGDVDAVAALAAELDGEGISSRRLRVGNAFHSHHMDVAETELRRSLARLRGRTARLPWYSSVTAAPRESPPLDASYWWRNVRDTVRFADAVAALAEDGYRLFLSLDAQPVLATAISQTLRAGAPDEPFAVVASLRRGEDEELTLARAAAQLFCAGVRIDLAAPAARQGGRSVRLPTYPWQHHRHWSESPIAAQFRLQTLGHAMLERRIPDLDPSFNATLSAGRHPYLTDHVIRGRPLVPAAAWIEIALEAASELAAGAPVRLVDVEFSAAAELSLSAGLDVVVSLRREDGSFRIASHADRSRDDFSPHASGGFREVPPGAAAGLVDRAGIAARCSENLAPGVFYESMRQAGFEYGPAFRCLTEIQVGDGELLARLELAQDLPAGRHQVHPTLLDAAIQCAAVLTGDEQWDRVYLPTSVRSVTLASGVGERVYCHGRVVARTSVLMVVDLVLFGEDGAARLTLEGMTCSALPQGISEARLQGRLYQAAWRPRPTGAADLSLDLDALRQAASEVAARYPSRILADPEIGALCRGYLAGALESLGLAAADGARALERPEAVVPAQRGRLRRLERALGSSVDLSCTARISGSPAAEQERAERWRRLFDRYPEAHSDLLTLRVAGEALAPVLSGRVSDEAVWSRPDLAALREEQRRAGQLHLARHLALRALLANLVARFRGARNLRVLLAGRRLAGLVEQLLPELDPEVASLTVAVVGSGQADRLRDRHHDVAALTVEELERAATPTGEFDLVLLCDVAGPADATGLGRWTRALTPGGLLAVSRATPPLAVALLDELGSAPEPEPGGPSQEDARESAATWQDALVDAGLGEAGAVALPEGCGLLLLARRPAAVAEAATPDARPQRQRLLLADSGSAAATLAAELCVLDPGATLAGEPELAGAVARRDGAPPLEVVCLWPLDADAVAHETLPARGLCLRVLQAIRVLAQADAGAAFTLVTRGAQGVDGAIDLRLGGLGGLLRVAANELRQLRFRSIDLADPPGPEMTRALGAELEASDGEDHVLLGERSRRVLRLAPLEVATDAGDAQAAPPASRPFRLVVDGAGALDRLRLVAAERRAPGPGQVEVAVSHVGLNFRDVLKVLGMYPRQSPDAERLGDEAAGHVVRVGAGVPEGRVGERVALALPGGCAASHVLVDELAACPLPAGLPLAEAACQSTVWRTAWTALVEVARLQAGERVLIHSGSGGVGLAAVRLAQRLGAEVFASAGSELKRELLRWLGVAHVHDSRRLAFADEIRDATGGEGIDVVLNALHGDALRRSLELLRAGGRFVEIGKRDLFAGSRISLRPFRHGISFTSLDLAATGAAGDAAGARPEHLGDGRAPPVPFQTFAVADARAALRYISEARQIGKVVLATDQGWLRRQALPVRAQLPLRRGATYLVTGGLSGLGLDLAEWLRLRGAESLVLCSRSGPASEAARAGVERLRARGTRVLACAVDVSDDEAVRRLLAETLADLPPLRGIVHAAAHWRDELLTSVDEAAFDAVWRPKAEGAWHLHRHSLGLELDFFVLLSSMSNPMGSPGQAAYAAANGFLEALARHRRERGLPAAAVGLDRVGQVGYVARNAALAAYMDRQGSQPLNPETVHAALDHLVANRLPVAYVSATRWGALDARVPGLLVAPRFEELRQQADADDAPGDAQGLRARWHELAPEARLPAARDYLRAALARLLGVGERRITPKASLADLGLDSLLAVELFTTIQTELAASLSASRVVQSRNLDELALNVLGALNLSAVPAGIALETPEAPSPLRDLELCDGFELPRAAPAETARAVLLTGATGFVGAYVLGELLSQTSFDVHCLVRACDAEEARTRLLANAARRGVELSQPERVFAVPGDLAVERFGWDEASFQELAARLAAIYHCAGEVDHVKSYAALRDANVLGTREALRLATAGAGRPLHFLSTLAVFGEEAYGRRLRETDPPSAFREAAFGYGTSKAVAEELVRRLRDRGLPATIHRTGPLLAPDGRGVSADDLLWRLLRLCVDRGLGPSGGGPTFLNPVRYVAAALVWLSGRPASLGKTFHLTLPESPPFEALLSAAREVGYEIADADAETWGRLLADDAQATPAIAAMKAVYGDRLLRFLSQVAGGGLQVGCEVSQAALAGSGIAPPPVDGSLLRAQIQSLITTGAWPAISVRET